MVPGMQPFAAADNLGIAYLLVVNRDALSGRHFLHYHWDELLGMLALAEVAHRPCKNQWKTETLRPSHRQTFCSGLSREIRVRRIETIFLLVIHSTRRGAKYLIGAHHNKSLDCECLSSFEHVECAQDVALNKH